MAASGTVNKQRGRLKKVSKNVFTVEFDVLLPTDEQLYSLTPLPWTTKSWIKGVEKGITNYTQTVFQERKGRGTLFDSHSRSGVAIQVKRQVNFVKFSSTPYITSILDKARKILK